jgi:hypothetical protein
VTTDPAATAPAPEPEPEPVRLKIEVTSEQVATATVNVVRNQLLAALEREGQLQASVDSLAQRHVTAQAEWDAEREQLMATINTLRQQNTGGGGEGGGKPPPGPARG